MRELLLYYFTEREQNIDPQHKFRGWNNLFEHEETVAKLTGYFNKLHELYQSNKEKIKATILAEGTINPKLLIIKNNS